ncbi:MAG: type II toxin-antitoxin system VapB family antitoxin [Thermoanaerobaculia bacterium]
MQTEFAIRTTLNLDPDLVAEAQRLTGMTERHLLASAALATSARLWIRVKRLAQVASELGFADEGLG